MKKFRYLLFFLIALFAASCTEETIAPREDDPIVFPPKPPK